MKRLLTLMLVALLALGAGTAYSAEGDSNITRLVIEATSGGMIKDSSGNIVLGTGTSVPADSTSGYAKGAYFIDTDVAAGTSGTYINIGSTTSCNFDLVEAAGALTPEDLTVADTKIIVGNSAGIGTAVSLSGASITNAGAFTLGSSSVTSSMIAVANVATSDLADSSVTTAKIAVANVGTTDLADSAVTSAKIAVANVATSDLADSSVTTAKIAVANVTNTDLGADAVTEDKIAVDNVTASEIRIVSKTLVIASGSAHNSTPYDSVINASGAVVLNQYATTRTGTDSAFFNTMSISGGVVKITLNGTADANQTWAIKVLAP